MTNSRVKLPDIIVGNRYGRLIAIAKLAERMTNGDGAWLVKCDCGKEKKVAQYHLKTGHTQSCGCITLERITKHGHCESPTYKTWENMISRCTNPKATGWHLYGGRGISVSENWKDFNNFFKDMGERPAGTTLDRIDYNGNYEFANCRWATIIEQANNTRSNKFVNYRGQRLTLAQLSKLSGIGYKTLQQRLNKGMTTEEAVNTPLKMVGWRVKLLKEQQNALTQ